MYLLNSDSLKYMLIQYPRSIMPAFWDKFEVACDNDYIISSRETRKKVEQELSTDYSLEWVNKHRKIFKTLDETDANVLGEYMLEGIFNDFEEDPRFARRRLPEDTPFLIAMAKSKNGIIVYRQDCLMTDKLKALCKKAGIKNIELEEMILQLN